MSEKKSFIDQAAAIAGKCGCSIDFAKEALMINSSPLQAIDWIIRNDLSKEKDPDGKDPHQPGAKLDAGKNRIGLMMCDFSGAIKDVARVTTYGATRYTPRGWLSVENGIERYTDAMYRHLLAETEEENDRDSKLRHAAHAAWNALARLQLIINEEKVNNDQSN